MRIAQNLYRSSGGTFALGLALLIVVLAALPARRSVAEEKPAPAIAPELLDSYAGGLIGSKHDFSDGGRIARDLCTACHTPHITNAQAPLLVRRPAATQPARSYKTAVGDLNEASLICLSCHDGVIAPDVYAGSHAIQWYDLSTGGVDPGKTRMTSHPIGVPYPPRSADTGYHSAQAAVQKGKVRFYDGRIQCTTCHDPHNTGRHKGMLWTSNERSRLCLSCHKL